MSTDLDHAPQCARSAPKRRRTSSSAAGATNSPAAAYAAASSSPPTRRRRLDRAHPPRPRQARQGPAIRAAKAPQEGRHTTAPADMRGSVIFQPTPKRGTAAHDRRPANPGRPRPRSRKPGATGRLRPSGNEGRFNVILGGRRPPTPTDVMTQEDVHRLFPRGQRTPHRAAPRAGKLDHLMQAPIPTSLTTKEN